MTTHLYIKKIIPELIAENTRANSLGVTGKLKCKRNSSNVLES